MSEERQVTITIDGAQAVAKRILKEEYGLDWDTLDDSQRIHLVNCIHYLEFGEVGK